MFNSLNFRSCPILNYKAQQNRQKPLTTYLYANHLLTFSSRTYIFSIQIIDRKLILNVTRSNYNNIMDLLINAHIKYIIIIEFCQRQMHECMYTKILF